MKKSITFLAIALLAAGAANANVSTSETNSIKVSLFNDVTTSKYVSFANSELLDSELGSLTKGKVSIDDAISADAQLTEAAVVTYLPSKKKQVKKVYPKAIRN